MEEASAPKPLIEYKTKVELDNNILNISLIQKSNILIIQANQVNSIPPFLYEGEYTKKDLDSVSRYFRMFDDISDLFPELQNKKKKKEFKINKSENNIELAIKLNIKNIPDFSLNLKKKNNSLDITVESLCELVNNMQKEMTELKKEIVNLKAEIKTLKGENKEIAKKKENQLDSKILINNEDIIMVNNWIRQNAKLRFELLYRVSRDGDRISTFTEKVRGKSPTLILIKSKAGYKFGGYTSVEWDMKGSYTYKEDKSAFIFSINNKQKFNIINNNYKYAICGAPNHFAFGGGHDLTIWDNCTSNDNKKDYSYGHTYNTSKNYELTGGSQSFYVEELEVYQVIYD